MPEHNHALARRCPHCDGFPAVAVTTGQRTPAGYRETITATCPACHGTGSLPLAKRVKAGATC
ncbi:hypothetical protein [Streptomyces cinnamoneus]|uniref:Uncharacterized protein n=1 Tax=Streptomyces cinnamoneus TaxID=53446 RepID=A0A918TKR8_STRCJ|nr:hypothetical protein [Streptomyces cinnamoneus]GHC52337.1 hypothetical protein GCM10010507_30570 [Streptomyces cinnamoneus]